MSDQNRRNCRVELAVYRDTKEEWERAVENDPNVASVSQLVRLAVNLYLNDDNDTSGASVAQDVHEHLTDLTTRQQKVLQRLDQVNGRLTEIRDAVVGTEVGPEIEALADDIFEELPTKQEMQTNSVFTDDFDVEGVPAPEPGTIEWLNEHFGAPKYQIQSALDYLREQTHSVQRSDQGQYYKEVQ
ncbi:MAG: hypothetical protein ABEH81_13475 [Halopenitus sp.]